MGAQEIPNRLQASCLIDGDGSIINSNGIAAVTRNGLGDYSVDLSEEIAESQAVIICEIDSAAGFAAYAPAATPVTNRINVATATGANPPVTADQRFTLNVWQLPRQES